MERRLVLITQKNSKREIYFLEAAKKFNVNPTVYYSYEEYILSRKSGDVIKLDPPNISQYAASELNVFTKKYFQWLDVLNEDKTVSFLNTPQSIMTTLDKRITKKLLIDNAVPTPQLILGDIQNYVQLIENMKKYNKMRVFVKPVFGSGAAGVCAFTRNELHNKSVLYTSLMPYKKTWKNTKKVTRYTDTEVCREILNFVLSLDSVVEFWIPKPKIEGHTFDLRVVWQFGEIDAIVVRGSDNPITNLHLNDMALPIESAMEWIDIDKLEKICSEAVRAVKGLNSAGLDVLCTESGYQIIEINSQGDLIYKDIFHENKIYTRQIEYMSEILQ